MINFGVREVADSKATAAPGWAYVPDIGVNTSVSALQPARNKRQRTQLAPNQHETTAKQDAKILRELTALDRESHREVLIPVPVRHRDCAGRVSHGKVTPAVRKILQSQKTFANHLADYEALSTLHQSLPTSTQLVLPHPTAPAVRSTLGISASSLSKTAKRPHKKKDPNAAPSPTTLGRISTAPEASTPLPIKSETSHDIAMLDVHVRSLKNSVMPPPHPEDNNSLLISRIPAMPSQEEIERLLAQPALSYNDAKGSWTAEDSRKPVRSFCDVCGYWGRVKCTRCGGRVCALECLSVHQEECFIRYGA